MVFTVYKWYKQFPGSAGIISAIAKNLSARLEINLPLISKILRETFFDFESVKETVVELEKGFGKI